jgi:hypothetical protein
MSEQTIFTPDEAINEFYRLKDKYESTYYEKYVKPIIRSNKSKREKRVEYSKLPKHECINCKRNVGTLWDINIDTKNNIRYFKAKCGDKNDPCPLDIQIDYAVRESKYKEIIIGLADIEKIKLNIIKEKNNALFFNKDVADIFNKLTEDLKFETEHTGYMIESNILTNDNPEKAVILKQTIDEFGKGFILPFKQMIKEYNETNNELILNQAVTFYINEMIPKLKEILSLKYDVSMVEFDESQNIYKLIQLPNTLESNEYYIKSDDKVVKFIRGVRKEKNKTRKELDTRITSKKKTRKIKPVADLVLEDEEEEIIKPGDEGIIEEKLESKFGEPIDIKPIFNESGNVTWNNEEYNNLWKSMPYQLKELLLQDHDWLEDFVNTCYKLRKEGKPCELFLPKQAQFPPVLGSDGKYEFNSIIVNNLFNRLSKSHQDTLLTVYSIKDGVKNYDSLKYTLASMLAKDINFQRGYF